MLERPKKEIKTPNGHLVVINTYLTGGESDTLKELIWGSIGLDIEHQKVANTMPGSALLQQERKTLEFMVVSVDGVAADVINLLRDLPQEDYQAVVTAVNEVSKLNFTPAK